MYVHQENSEASKDDKDLLPNLEADSFSVDFDEEVEASGIGCRASTLHVVRVSIGTGILSMPYTLMHLGYCMGAVVFILAGIIYYYVVRKVLRTETKMRQQLKVSNLSYVELASHVFKASPFPFNKCGNLVKYFICVLYSMPFANTVYLVVMGEGLRNLARFFGTEISMTVAVSVLIVPLTVFCLFQRILKMLVPYSSVTNVITIGLACAVIIFSMVNKMVGSEAELNSTTNKSELVHLVAHNREPITIKAFGDVSFIPKSLAMYIQIFSCTSLLFAINSDLQKPKKLTKTFGILNVSAFLVMMVHYFFGLSLYIIYGNATHDNILKNLPQNSKLSRMIEALFCLTLFVSYILTFFARFNNVWTNSLKPNFKSERFATPVEYTIRIGYNLFAYVLAVTIPNFALVAAFTGSLSFIVDIGLSSLLIVLYKLAYQKCKWSVILKNAFIICICLVLFGVSMKKNVDEVIGLYSSPNSTKINSK